MAHYLNYEKLERLGAILEARRAEHLWPVAALRLLTLTGVRLSEVLELRWDEIGELSGEGASVWLEDSKTGPRTLWLGSQAVKVLAALPCHERGERVFPEVLASARFYNFWCAVREDAGLQGGRRHRPRHGFQGQAPALVD